MHLAHTILCSQSPLLPSSQLCAFPKTKGAECGARSRGRNFCPAAVLKKFFSISPTVVPLSKSGRGVVRPSVRSVVRACLHFSLLPGPAPDQCKQGLAFSPRYPATEYTNPRLRDPAGGRGAGGEFTQSRTSLVEHFRQYTSLSDRDIGIWNGPRRCRNPSNFRAANAR